MKLRLYVDTSVLGGIYDSEFEEWSRRLMQEFREGNKIIVLSDLTLREIEDAPENVQSVIKEIPDIHKELVVLNAEAKDLATRYIDEGVVSEQYLVDAQHIAIATLNRVDVLVSWNFKHIVNLEKIRMYNSVNLKYGYQLIDIRSPREVLHEEERV